MRKELIGLKGGTKHMWLNQHADEICQFHHDHGTDATMREFGFSKCEVLERVLAKYTYLPPTIITPDAALARIQKAENERVVNLADRALIISQISGEQYRELKHRIRELEQWQQKAAPIIELVSSLLTAMRANAGANLGVDLLRTVSVASEAPDDLGIGDLLNTRALTTKK